MTNFAAANMRDSGELERWEWPKGENIQTMMYIYGEVSVTFPKIRNRDPLMPLYKKGYIQLTIKQINLLFIELY